MKTKIVKYLNQKYEVGNCAKFMTTDKDGGVFWYADSPEINDSGFWIPLTNAYGEAVYIPDDCFTVDWSESLREI